MDSVHEAHLARILEARRRRGVLGMFPSPQTASLRPEAKVFRSDAVQTTPQGSSMTGTQTDRDGAVTMPPEFLPSSLSTHTAPKDQYGGPSTSGELNPSKRDHPSPMAMRGTPSNISGVMSSIDMLSSPRPRPYRQTDRVDSSSRWRHPSTAVDVDWQLPSRPPNVALTGDLRMISPSRIPSLAYSTPGSSSQQCYRGQSSPWRRGGLDSTVDPLPPSLYVPRRYSSPPSRGEPPLLSSSLYRSSIARGGGGGAGGWLENHPSSEEVYRFSDPSPPRVARWASGSLPRSPMLWRSDLEAPSRRWIEPEPPIMPLPSSFPSNDHRGYSQQRRDSSSASRRTPSRRRRASQCSPKKSKSREAPSRSRNRYSSLERYPLKSSQRHRRTFDGTALARSPPSSEYMPPVVYMDSPSDTAPRHSSSEKKRERRRPSVSVRSPRRRTVQKMSLGLPDARSTMDLRTSIETLRAGDWFYKWTAKGNEVHRRWVWVDTKSYLLLWAKRETRDPHFCGDVRLEHICQVTSRELSSVDQDGFPKTYYVLLIETVKRVVQLATELRDKCDAWFEALNNVMAFIRRNGVTKGDMIPD